jgi:hypothetical protein
VTAPRRWLDDPEADATLRDVLRGASGARPLDQVTRRRLGVKVARASALPAVAAGWLFVKSAAAALGIVLGTGALAVQTGIIEWRAPAVAELGPPPPKSPTKAVPAPRAEPIVSPAASEVVAEAPAQLNPTPSLPIATASSASSLAAEAALLETARAKMRGAPAEALALAAQHTARFPRGQLSSERALIQIEALHRLRRDAEARGLARSLLKGSGAGMYAERVRQLLGETAP